MFRNIILSLLVVCYSTQAQSTRYNPQYLASLNVPASGSNAPALPFTNGLQLVLKMDETSGTRYDALGNYNFSAVSGPGDASGQISNAVSLLSASSQYLQCSTASNAINASQGTISMWCYSFDGATGTETPLYISTAGYGTLLGFQLGSTFYCGFYSGGNDYRVITACNSANCPQNTWIHYVLTWTQGGYCTLYTNGVELAHSSSIVSYQPSATMYLGVNWICNCSYYNGRLDEFYIWNYDISTNRTATNLVWRMYTNGVNGHTYPNL